MTVGEFVDRPEYALAEQASSRNARRIAALIGGAFTTAGVNTVMEVEPDRATYRSHPQIAAELLAVPSHQVVYNCFDTVGLPHEISSRGHAVLYRDGVANVNRARGEVLKMLDANVGFVLRSRDPSATFVEPIASSRMFERQEDNHVFMAQKQVDRHACRQHAQNSYLTREGGAPSSNSRVFWHTSAAETAAPSDTRLVPHVMVVYGKPARQRAV
jgi:hypothetical protein